MAVKVANNLRGSGIVLGSSKLAVNGVAQGNGDIPGLSVTVVSDGTPIIVTAVLGVAKDATAGWVSCQLVEDLATDTNLALELTSIIASGFGALPAESGLIVPSVGSHTYKVIGATSGGQFTPTADSVINVRTG